MKTEVFEENPPVGWDSLLETVPESTFFQSTAFAEALRADFGEFGKKPVYFVAKEGERAKCVLLAFESNPVKKALENSSFGRAAKTFSNAFKILEWTNGPIVLQAGRSSQCLDSLLKQVLEYARKRGLMQITGMLPPLADAQTSGEVETAFSANGFRKKEAATFIVNTERSEGELWRQLDKTARKAVEDCKNQGVTVSIAETRKEFDEYLELLKEFRKKSGLLMPPFYPSERVWEKLRGKGIDVFVARKDGAVISGIGVVYLNRNVTEIAVARSSIEFEEKIYAQDLLKWEVIRWCGANGFAHYDLAGVAPEPSTPKEKGIHQFKAKWGGNKVKYASFDKIVSKTRYAFYNALKKLKEKSKR